MNSTDSITYGELGSNNIATKSTTAHKLSLRQPHDDRPAPHRGARLTVGPASSPEAAKRSSAASAAPVARAGTSALVTCARADVTVY